MLGYHPKNSLPSRPNHAGSEARPILRLDTGSRKPVRLSRKSKTIFAQPSQHSRLLNPLTEQKVFGFVPRLAGTPQQVSRVPIILPFGRHSDGQSGFGATHILERHRDMLLVSFMRDVRGVANFVAIALRQGSCLYWQDSCEGKCRISAYRHGLAKVVLEYNEKRGEAFWTVITGFAADSCDGDVIGRLTPVRIPFPGR